MQATPAPTAKPTAKPLRQSRIRNPSVEEQQRILAARIIDPELDQDVQKQLRTIYNTPPKSAAPA